MDHGVGESGGVDELTQRQGDGCDAILFSSGEGESSFSGRLFISFGDDPTYCLTPRPLRALRIQPVWMDFASLASLARGNSPNSDSEFAV